MKLAVIAFTRSGCGYAMKIQKAVEAEGNQCEICGKGREAGAWGIPAAEESLKDWTGRQSASQDALIFIGAAGIAVRAIAPFVADKASDPAVLCMDEQGRFVISLLSGHLGGANELAEKIACICGAVPVITTATDAGGRFSVDSFARREHLYLDNLKLAKRISAEVLENRTIGFYSDFPWSGELPLELALETQTELGISISLDENLAPFPETLHLVPRITVLGIGCRRGTSKEEIEALVKKVMDRNRLSMHSIGKVASIDLKEQEQGLLDFCEAWDADFVTYSREELEEVACVDGFSESAFVKEVTGVGNVCERSALKAAGQTRLFQKKTAEQGVTVAAALVEYQVQFS